MVAPHEYKFPLWVHFDGHENKGCAWIGRNQNNDDIFHYAGSFMKLVQLSGAVGVPPTSLLVVCLDKQIHIPWYRVKDYLVDDRGDRVLLCLPLEVEWHRVVLPKDRKCCVSYESGYEYHRRTRRTIMCIDVINSSLLVGCQ